MPQREKRQLGDVFGLTSFGVNQTTLPPRRGVGLLLHRHSKQDELVYVLEGEATLVTDEREVTLRRGMCMCTQIHRCATRMTGTALARRRSPSAGPVGDRGASRSLAVRGFDPAPGPELAG